MRDYPPQIKYLVIDDILKGDFTAYFRKNWKTWIEFQTKKQVRVS